MEDALKARIGWVLYAALTVAVVAVAVWRWILVAQSGQDLLPIGWLRFRMTLWASGLLLGGLIGFGLRATPGRALGVALFTVPVWGAFWGFINSIPELTIVSAPLRAQSEQALSNRYIRGILYDFSYLGLGFLLWARPDRSLRAWARGLRQAGFRMGAGEGTSMLAGVFLFPILLLGTWGLDWLISNQAPQLINGDESLYWSNMTLYHALMLSAAAAFTEELVYRVVALAGAAWLARKAGAGPRTAIAIGVGAQAVLFAMAHGGYGTWAHAGFPAAFGLLMGILVVFVGIWAAVVLHFLIDFFVFGSEVAAHDAGANVVLWGFLVANIVITLWLLGRAWVRWVKLRELPWTPFVPRRQT